MSLPRTSANGLACCALLGMFVIENHCGLAPMDHGQLAVHFLERELYERALREARRAARQDRADSRPHVIAALAHLGLERIDETVASLRTAILTQPDNAALYATLRDICLQQERIDLARDTFRSLLEEMPDSWQVRAGLGWAHLRLDEDDKALPLLEAAVAEGDSAAREDPRFFARGQLGRAYMRQQRIEDAARVLKHALEFDHPDNLRLSLALGECYLLQGHPSAAEEAFTSALATADDVRLAAIHIAQTYYDAGMRSRAITYYERAMDEKDPPDALLLNNLAWAYAEEGIELERAELLSREAVKSEADNVVYLDTYAEVLYLKGQRRRAIAIMALAIDLEPEDGEQYDYLRQQMQKFRSAADL